MLKKNKPTKKDNTNELEYNQIPPEDIFAYNELRSCADLFRLHKDKILDIQPEFQRNVVWSLAFQTRFIDSLLKELPIPSMCFSYDKNKNEMRVIDGLQRISSIIKFLNTDSEWRLSKLEDIDPKISGKSNIEIKEDAIEIFSNVQNRSLPITFLRVNHDKPDHDEYLFTIFHRLNTYGQKLNNQEIRNCIYSGQFNFLLKSLNNYKNWKKLLNIKNDNRFVKVELILRFFAFFDKYKTYKGILTKFLNLYMSENRRNNEKELNNKEKLFNKTIDLVLEKICDNKPISRTSNAFIDTLLFGVAKNLDYLEKKTPKEIKNIYSQFTKLTVLKEQNLKNVFSLIFYLR